MGRGGECEVVQIFDACAIWESEMDVMGTRIRLGMDVDARNPEGSGAKETTGRLRVTYLAGFIGFVRMGAHHYTNPYVCICPLVT